MSLITTKFFRNVLISSILFHFFLSPMVAYPDLQTKPKNTIEDPCNIQDPWIPSDALLNSLREFDVLVVGEEHDDKDGHRKKLILLNALSQIYALSLSMEMLEWHQNASLQEYLSGVIPLTSFLNDSNLWKNFTTDYLPLINCARLKSMPVIPANPSRKYINLIGRKGILGYRDIAQENLHLLPQPHNILRDRSLEYEKRLRSVFVSFPKETHSDNNREMERNSAIERMILAQHAWDAGMSEKILQEHHRSGNKIVHINGRFHSDYGGGVPYRLKKSGLRVVTLTLLPDTAENRKLETSKPRIADFLIFTNQPID